MQHRQRFRAIRSLARRPRRPRRTAVAAAALAVLATVGIPSTGAYFTAESTATANSVDAASFPAVAGLTAAKAGTSTALSWTDVVPALRSSGITGDAVYSVQRSSTADFVQPTTVYTGRAASFSDAGGIAPSVKTVEKIAGNGSSTSLSVGGGGSCTVLSTGRGACWGWGNGGRLGTGWTGGDWEPDATTPKLVSGSSYTGTWRTLSTGTWSTCGINGAQSLYCWGQLPGNGKGGFWTSPTLVDAGSLAGRQVIDVSTGMHYGATCAVALDGDVGCWGHGQRGVNGTFSDTWAPRSLSTGPLARVRVVDVETNGQTACALRWDNVLACWGSDIDGSLGSNHAGTSLNPVDPRFYPDGVRGSTTPVRVDMQAIGRERIVQMSSGKGVMCVLTEESSIYCWGRTESGTDYGARPSRVDTGQLTRITGFTVTRSGLCAVDSGQLFCWGTSITGELGTGTNTSYSTPQRVNTGPLADQVISQVEARGGVHTCARTESGTISCWGQMTNGRLGDGTSARYDAHKGLPQKVTTVSTRVLECPPTAVLLAGETCSLADSSEYYYRVSYAVEGIPAWTSPAVTARRT